MSELLHLEDHGPIATLTFAYPDRRNALSAAMFEALEPAIDAVETATGSGGADSCRVLRLRGEGPAFCAGFDLDAMADEGLLPSFLERLGAFCRRLRRLDAVVAFGLKALGQPNRYLWGGSLGPDFDCSGLVQTAYAS